MFYLKVFWESILNNKVNGIVFTLLTFSIIYLVNNEVELRSKFAKKYIQEDQKIYFRAIVPENIDATKIVLKMRDIPGVLGVYQEEGRKLKDNIQKNLKENGIYIPKYMFEENIKVVEVILSTELSKANHELIKNYLVRYIDSEQTVVSSIHYPPEDSLRTFLVSFFLKWTIKIIGGLLGIFFCFSYFSFIKTIFQQSYIYQNYQRRLNIAPKSLSIGLVAILFLFYSVIALFFNVTISSIPIIVGFLLFFYFAFSKVLSKDVRHNIN